MKFITYFLAVLALFFGGLLALGPPIAAIMSASTVVFVFAAVLALLVLAFVLLPRQHHDPGRLAMWFAKVVHLAAAVRASVAMALFSGHKMVPG